LTSDFKPSFCNATLVSSTFCYESPGHVMQPCRKDTTDLYFPDRYLFLDEVFLRPCWETFHPSWSHWDDALTDIAGFIPFGFLFCAYFSLAGRIKRPPLVTIHLGLTVSLAINLIRDSCRMDSDTTDIITNTLGTCFGVWLYRFNVRRVLFARIWAHLVGTAAKGQLAPLTPCHARVGSVGIVSA
jgi:hypothetical protein